MDDHLPLAEAVAAALKLRVIMDNDATAAALGEHWRGVGEGAEDFIYLYLGTGIGGGLVLDGQAYRGLRGNTGEISHIQVDPNGPSCECGSHGCLALYTNPDGLLREAAKVVLEAPPPTRSPSRRRRSSGSPPTPTRASSGSSSDAGAHLAKVVVECSRVLDPELIVLGGPLLPTLGGPFGHAIEQALEADRRARGLTAPGARSPPADQTRASSARRPSSCTTSTRRRHAS